jgi:predicted NAD/FAD-binding protein
MLCTLEHWLVRHIGRYEAGFFRKILAEGWSYPQVAHSWSQSGTIASDRVANWFVKCLEELAELYRTNPPLFQGGSADPVPRLAGEDQIL